MKLLLSSGLSAKMAIKAGDLVEWEASSTNQVYRSTVRGLVTKIPGFFFSGLNTV